MSALTIAVPAHYKYAVCKQQTVGVASAQLTQLASTDAIKGRPDNIFLQALAANTGKIYVSNVNPAVSGGIGFELSAGANINLPTNDATVWYVIASAAAQTLNITYQSTAS